MTYIPVVLILAVVGGFIISTDNLSQFGADPAGTRLERIHRSPNYDGKVFVNTIDTNLSFKFAHITDMLNRWMFGKSVRVPKMDIPVNRLDKMAFNTDPENGLRVTWIGHSTLLIEIDGKRILTDPIWSKRCSPSTLFGPVRFHPPPIPLEDLPPIDAVLISHDHYDHLDKESVMSLAKTGTLFVVPLGIGSHLEEWKIDPSQIVELDWWESFKTSDNGISLTATPARHFSGRGLTNRYSTLWASWVIIGSKHRVYFSGDTGPFPGFSEIGGKFGPFDVTLIKIAAYDRAWPDIHLNPEQAVNAHIALNGKLLIPIHWGTFNLAYHDWFEPPDRVVKAAEKYSIQLAIPRPGEMVDPSNPVPLEQWWNKLK
jgi:L-ascorbate metabolism protein UlaG (beta-lactamase superfamily)